MMSETQITADDITHWETIDDIATSLKKRGLKPRPSLDRENGFEDELLIETEEDKYIALIEASPGDEPSDYNRFQSSAVPTTFVSTRDFQTFSIIRRKRIIGGDKHGRLDRQKFSFNKEQITSGDRYSALDKLNDIEYGDDSSLNSLFDTRQVVDEFYEEFESIRTDLVTKVSGIDDDRGDAKQRYVQVTLNRLIFLHFIQEKGLLGAGEGDYLLAKHDEFAADGDVQTNFYEPLFFKALAEEGFQSRKFDRVPYLNGGLFSETAVEQEFEDARLGADAAESDDLYREILEFLDSWNWNVDERLDVVEPKNLSPSVLGHIFEQSVNQKEKGAYYTPEEITSFMARESIHPRILDAVNEATGADYDEIDAIFGLDETPAQGESGSAAVDGGAITQQAAVDAASTDHVETLYFDVLKDLHVLDPAVGSGAFLLAAEDVLMDIYLHAIEYFERLYDAQPFEVSDQIKDELDAVNDAGSKTLYTKREIILNNLYGVDIDDGAVEICKLRLWLSMVADIEDDPSAVDPLPNIDFNIRQGNSLIGFTDLLEVDTNGNQKLANYGEGVGEAVREKYEDVIEATENHRQARTKEQTERWRREAEQRREQNAVDLDKKILEQFHDAGIENMDHERLKKYSPFHWVIEFPTVYRNGGFDVLIGNPPWDVLDSSSDEFFSRYKPDFRTLSQDEKQAFMEEKISDQDIKKEWEEYQKNVERLTEYFKNSGEYELQTPVVDGETATYKNDLSKLFFERIFKLASNDAYVSQVLSGVVVNAEGAKDLRMQLLNEASTRSVIEFENNNIFDIDDRKHFAIITFKNSGRSEELTGLFNQTDTNCLTNFSQAALELPRRVLADYSPEARIFPWVGHQKEVDVLNEILKHPPLRTHIENAWNIDLLPEELNETRDRRRGYFAEDVEDPDYPVYTGKNIYQFQYNTKISNEHEDPKYWSINESRDPERSAKRRVRQKRFNSGEPKKAIYEGFGGPSTNKTQIGFVDDLLKEKRGHGLDIEDVRLDASEYRIGYRDVANAGNERTMIASILPPEILCVHSLATFRPFKIDPSEDDLTETPLHSAYERRFTDQELFVAVGLINSLPFDYLMRTKTDKHLVEYKLLESQVPRLTEGDQWFDYIWERAARLNCYGEAFEEIRKRLDGVEPVTEHTARKEIRAEIDAAAFHAYDIEEKNVIFVLEDFSQVGDPRMMDDTYFEMVLEKYRKLSNDQPAGD
jgi:hypothetical protein